MEQTISVERLESSICACYDHLSHDFQSLDKYFIGHNIKVKNLLFIMLSYKSRNHVDY